MNVTTFIITNNLLIKFLTIIFIMTILSPRVNLPIDIAIIYDKSIVSLCSLIFRAITIINGKVTFRSFRELLVLKGKKYRRYKLLINNWGNV